jgi:membrane-associated protein
MTSVISFLLSYLLLYKYITLFIFIFLAGLIIPIPVNILLVAVGAFSVQQYFNFSISLVVATIANVAGDTGAYFFFSRFGKDILRDKYIKKYSFFLHLEKYFESNAGVSIFVSRIVGIFGIPVNFLSGYSKTQFLKFVFFDVIGNIAFVLIFLSLGYVVGDEWVNISGFINTGMDIVSVIVLLIVIVTLYYPLWKPEHSTSSQLR